MSHLTEQEPVEKESDFNVPCSDDNTSEDWMSCHYFFLIVCWNTIRITELGKKRCRYGNNNHYSSSQEMITIPVPASGSLGIAYRFIASHFESCLAWYQSLSCVMFTCSLYECIDLWGSLSTMDANQTIGLNNCRWFKWMWAEWNN